MLSSSKYDIKYECSLNIQNRIAVHCALLSSEAHPPACSEMQVTCGTFKGPFTNDVSREGEGGGYVNSDAVKEVA